MRVALVHDWLTGMRGGEKCLEVLCRLWPQAHLYTLIHRRGRLSPAIERMDIRTSFLQHVPGVFRHYRHLLPLMPMAIESFRLADYDLVVSLSHCVAKSVRVPVGVPHICYCFTPMRYAWHMREAYWAGGGRRSAEGQMWAPGSDVAGRSDHTSPTRERGLCDGPASHARSEVSPFRRYAPGQLAWPERLIGQLETAAPQELSHSHPLPPPAAADGNETGDGRHLAFQSRSPAGQAGGGPSPTNSAASKLAHRASVPRDATQGNRSSASRHLLALRSPISALRSLLLADLRRWDRATSDRVTQFIAISRTVQQRIRECYGRDSVVVYPPVDVEFYTPAPGMRERGFVVHAARVPVAEESQAGRLRRGTKRLAEGGEDFYLCVSALTPYKRLDLAIEACNRLKRRLVVIGCGPEEARLRAMAGPTIEFLGWQSDEAIRDHYRRCHALLFPGVEDFGIVPLEAQACGAPVIAYGAGGATETVIPPTASVPGTGLLFMDQSAESLMDAIRTLERQPELACPTLARSNAVRFRTDRFATEIESSIDSAAGAGPVRTDAGPARAA